jgi:hypothetical protein
LGAGGGYARLGGKPRPYATLVSKRMPCWHCAPPYVVFGEEVVGAFVD